MEFMEPKDIDWSRVVSRYVRDETYEGIQAPHWADLTDPNAGRADVDDEAWFCRPGTPLSSLPLSSWLPLARRRAGGRCSCCLLVGPVRLDWQEIKSKQCALIGGSPGPVLAFFLGDGFSCDIGTLLLNERVLIY